MELIMQRTSTIAFALAALLAGGCATQQTVAVPDRVTSIQRVNTSGGIAPKTGCSKAAAGTPARVSYAADYYFFAAK
jgi:hypothetical protein